MLGRRQIREKVLQSIYGIELSGNDSHVVEKNLLKGIEQIYDLYLLLLNLNLVLVELAEDKIELGKQKRLPSEQDINPNQRFVRNQVYNLIKINLERSEYCKKNKQLVWDKKDSFVTNLYNEIQKSAPYNKFMTQEKLSFKQDKSFAISVYEHVIAPYKGLEGWVADMNLNWADDFHIANSMVLSTLQSFTPKGDENLKLFKPFKNAADKEFASELFRKTFNKREDTLKLIAEKATNWETERIASIDKIILQMALTEFIHFPSIPPVVSMNEYIELAKIYSTEKSKIFVNGILDKCLKGIKEQT